MRKVAVYPGTFDPITKGHIDVIKRGSEIFDELVILIALHKEKHTLFSLEERVEMVKCATGSFENVSVEVLDNLLVHYLKENNIRFVLRGLRAVSDFDYELQMALTNSELYPDIETIFIMSSRRYIFLSSSIVREIASYGGDVSDFVPECVSKKLAKRRIK